MDSDPFSLELVCQLPWWGSPCILSVQYLMLGDNRPVVSKSWELLRTEVFMGSLEMPPTHTLDPGWRALPSQACQLLLRFWALVNTSRAGEPSSLSWLAVCNLQKTSTQWPCHHSSAVLCKRSQCQNNKSYFSFIRN